MFRFKWVILCLFLAGTLSAQEEALLTEELEDYKKKEISGIVFTSASVAFATLGTILMVANSESAYSYSNERGAGFGFSSPAGGIGLLITLPAAPLLIVGIVKWVKGANGKKRNTYY